MTGYNNATGDGRGLFSRFLPPTWRNIDSTQQVHNAVIGAIQDTLVEAESDLVGSKKESFLDTATGVFLNKWGLFSGIKRRDNETDEHYRNRIRKWFTKKKGTVNSLVENIKDEFENDELDVYIYEPWRNIFYLNKSVLNGVDNLQGHYYRFAVIDIHISSYVDIKRLAYIVDRYKDAGVQVYFTYENGMSLDAKTYNLELGVFSFIEGTYDPSSASHLKTTFPIGNPLSKNVSDNDLFRTNKSVTNGSDVLSGSPYRGKATYNLAGNGPLDKIPLTDATFQQATANILEYDDEIYRVTNLVDNLGYKVNTGIKAVKKQALVDGVISTLSIDLDAYGNLSYTVDEDKLPEDNRYYSQVILAHMDFKIVNDTILAYVYSPIVNESDTVTNMINDVISSISFSLDASGNVIPNPIKDGDKVYNSASDAYLFFNWDEYVLDTPGVNSVVTTTRYIKITTNGSQYGYNSTRVVAIDASGTDRAGQATWIKIGDTTANVANGTSISNPGKSSTSYILDLGQAYTIKTITLGDRFASPVSRTISVSPDGTNYVTVAEARSNGGDTISLVNYTETNSKAEWINNKLISSNLQLSIKDLSDVADIAIFDFDKKGWSSSVFLPSGDTNAKVNFYPGSQISKTGYSVVRINTNSDNFVLDFAGFNLVWVQNGTLLSTQLKSNSNVTNG